MATQQMDMNAAMPAPGMGPDQMAIFDRMRQEISPQEFSNEMLAGAAQIDPQAVATFTKELEGLDIPPEALDALNDVVDEILASPDKYAELRKKYMDMGLPEEVLPEQYDPQFFAALNMAIDQMIAAPTGVQAFAKGGIAELKPIAKAIASYGRNGDTMLAHITPAEARMLRRRGGSGTINPHTGLPEFFLKKLWKTLTAPIRAVGKAVQSFAKSSIGRIVLPIALGFFLGPGAAGLFNIAGNSIAGLAISGFVGSAGTTLLAGGSLKDALKAGAISGLTAGAVAGLGNLAGLSNIPLTGTAPTATFGESVLKQFETFKGYLPDALTGGTTPAAPAAPGLSAKNTAPVPSAAATSVVPPSLDFDYSALSSGTAASAPPSDLKMTGTRSKPFPEYFENQTPAGAAIDPVLTNNVTTTQERDAFIKSKGLDKPSSGFFDKAGDLYNKYISPSGIQEAGRADALSKTLAQNPGKTAAEIMSAPASSALGKAYASNMPGILSTYGPMAAVGLGAMSAFGGFKTQPAQTGPITQSLMTPVTQRIRQDGTQSQMYLQGLPGVQYDQFGEPIAGYKQLPTYDVPDYNAGGYGMYSGSGQGIMNLPTVYNTPSGSIGSSRVEQPYNTASMYSNIMPRRYADGGPINSDNPISPNDSAPEPVAFEPKAYLKANPDLVRMGITEADAKKHWENSGLKEGRSMNPAEAVAKQQAQTAADAENLAARTKVAQEEAMRKAQGSGNMYANINAGLAAFAPETFPGAPVTLSPERRAAIDAALKGTATDIQKSRVMRDNAFRPEEIAAYANLGFGEVNRRYNTALRQDAYAPMLEEQRNSMNQQRDIAYNVPTAPVKGEAVSQPPMGANPYSNITTPVTFPPVAPPVAPPAAAPAPMPAPFFKPGDPNSLYYQGSLPPGSFPANGGNFDGYDFIYDAPLPEGMMGTMGGTGYDPVTGRMDLGSAGGSGQYVRRAEVPKKLLNMGGIAALGMGGYPRRTGQISGPGTEKSDDIPAMLSDGEFVMTAKSVRGAGKGSRRAGAKKMYKLMHQLERNAERG